MSDAFDLACRKKFQRGVAEHGPGFGPDKVDAPKEIMDECCDIANYATLLPDRNLAAWATSTARLLWLRCRDLSSKEPTHAHGKLPSEHAGSSA